MRLRPVHLIVTIAVSLVSAAPLAQDRRPAPLSGAGGSVGGNRVALVVGNSAYTPIRLPNAANDAQDLSAVLTDLGFKTQTVLNAKRPDFDRAVDAFVSSLAAGDVALFYYAGHGFQMDGENYLVPVDFDPKDPADARYQAYSASRLSERIQAKRVRLTVLLLDACRDNPFAATRQAGGGGWAAMTSSGSGVYIMYATAPGRTASDNPSGRNGLFTTHLLSALRKPGLALNDVFTEVSDSVRAESGGRQDPWQTSSGGASSTILRAALRVAPVSLPEDIARREELAFWEAARDSKDPTVFEAYLHRYPDGRFKEVAQSKLGDVRLGSPKPAGNSPISSTAGINASRSLGVLQAECVDKIALSCAAVARRYWEATGVRADEKKAAGFLNQACNFGDQESCLNLSSLFRTGAGVRKSDDKAHALLARTCDAGYGPGCYELSTYYEYGVSVKEDRQKQRALLERSCSLGFPGGCTSLGFMYYQGSDLPKDWAKAYELWQRACEQDESAACGNLGSLYKNGDGVAVDAPKSMSLYGKACGLGSASSCREVANALWFGQGVNPDRAKAVGLYDRGCALGDVEACVDLGRRYASGSSIAKDDVKATAAYDRACRQRVSGCPELRRMYFEGRGASAADGASFDFYAGRCLMYGRGDCWTLAVMYDNGRGVRRDSAKAVEFYERGCKSDHSGACAALGDIYASGRGVAKDEARAAAIYVKHCQSDAGPYDPAACGGLGVLLAEGRGAPKDLDRALKLLERACDFHQAESCAYAGLMYENGSAGRVDPAKALTHFRAACASGNATGCRYAAIGYAEGRGTEKNTANAGAYYDDGCLLGDWEACTSLGLMYATGAGVTKDAARATSLYEQGCAAGYERACKLKDGGHSPSAHW